MTRLLDGMVVPGERAALHRVNVLHQAARQRVDAPATSPSRRLTPAHDVGALVIRAADGDRWSWEQLVVGYSHVVSSITAAHRLTEAEAARVRARVWRRLDRNLTRIRQPDRVGIWLGAVARDECVKALTTSACNAA